MRKKVVAFDYDDRAAFCAWIAQDGSVMIGGRVGKLKAMLDVIDDPNCEELKIRNRVKIRTRARVWSELVERAKERGFRVEEVRRFRRLVN